MFERTGRALAWIVAFMAGLATTASGITFADVSIVKTLVTAGPYTAGQSVTFTIVIFNYGPDPATSVAVTDAPTNLAITGVSGACAALPCTIPLLAAGASATIDVTATIAAAGGFNNGAQALATDFDPDLTNNASNAGGTATAEADLSIVKTLVTPPPYYPGGTVAYTLTIANAGPWVATAVVVTDTPSNLTIASVSGACAAFPCMIPSFANGATATINVTATIGAPGAWGNTASIFANESDPDPSNNTSTAGGTAFASADLSIVKMLATAGPYTPGQTVAYTLTVSNAGPSAATAVAVADTPSNLTIAGVSGACAAFPCMIPSVANGATATINVTATIGAAGAFDNGATVTAAEPDPDPSDNASNAGGTAAAAADLSIVKTLVTAPPYSAGGTIAYTLTIANAGPSAATSVQVTDTPSGMTLTTVSGSGCSAFPCTIPSLASGASTIIDVVATLDPGSAFDNIAVVAGSEFDPDPADNTDATGNGGTTGTAADVSIVKALATAGPFTAGQAVAYTIAVSNAGPSTATAVAVTDTPANLTIASVSGACAALPCTIPTLAAGATATINVTATIAAAGAFDNGATVTAAEPDPDTTNNADAAGNGGAAVASADLSVVKTLTTAGPFSTGQSIAYTIVVFNAGPSVATGVTIADTPSNLTIASVGGGSCAALPCTIPSLASGSGVTLVVTATIASAGSFDNGVTVTASEPDPDTANNADAAGNGGAAAAAIPFASPTGLILLALALAIAGTAFSRGA